MQAVNSCMKIFASWFARVERYYGTRNHQWLFLVLLGIFGGLVGYSVDIAIYGISLARSTFLKNTNGIIPTTTQCVYYTLIILAFVIFAYLVTYFVCEGVTGSGVPVVQAYINGASHLLEFISFKALVTKYLGLVAVSGAGLFIGKVGPNVHMSAMVSNTLLAFPFFSKMRENEFLRKQMLAIGCAIGIATNFGATASGVLFSVEVMGSYYSIRNYFKAFFAAVIAAVVSRGLNGLTFGNALIGVYWKTNFGNANYSVVELLGCVVLGIILGVLGALFNFLTTKFMIFFMRYGDTFLLGNAMKQRLNLKNRKSLWTLLELRFVLTMITSIATAIIIFPKTFGSYMSLGSNALVEDMFRIDMTDPGANAKDWGPNLFYTLGMSCIIRYFLSILTVALPIPAGIYLPLFISGSCFGRFYGEVLKHMFPEGVYGNPTIFAAGYAVVGASGLTAAATNAFSSFFIAFELTGIFLLPSMITTIISIIVARTLVKNIYDIIIQASGWPSMPGMKSDSIDKTVSRIAIKQPDIKYIAEVTTLREMRTLAQNSEFTEYPVVDCIKNSFLIGKVSRRDLLLTVEELSDFKHDLDKDIRIKYASAPFSLTKETPILYAHILFSTLNLNCLYVIDRGHLVGVVTKTNMRTYIETYKLPYFQNFLYKLRGKKAKTYEENITYDEIPHHRPSQIVRSNSRNSLVDTSQLSMTPNTPTESELKEVVVTIDP